MKLAFPPLASSREALFVWDSLEWWRWFTAFRRKPSVAAIARHLNQYDWFISFHAARPVAVAAYYENGLQVSEIENLNQQARARLLSSQHPQVTSDIIEAAIAKASRYDDRKLFLVLDARELSGHYLIYGSEHICGIAASITRQLDIDCRQLLKRFGTPTIFRVALPRQLIPDTQLCELAERLREEIWDERRELRPPPIDCSFVLEQGLPAEHIIDHTHPKEIPDPLLYNTKYTYRDNFPYFP